MLQSVDHIVILVKDLEIARADYTALGFVVVPGGEHSDGTTHNALISFADGTYLELIAFKKPNPAHRWWYYQAIGEGLIDFALLPEDITAEVAAIRGRGLALQGPFPGGRVRPDGQRINWQTAMATTRDLPFLCADVTPRALRVPGGEVWAHFNGVSGVARLGIVVSNLTESVSRYQALLGSAPQSQTQDGEATFTIGAAAIMLVEPKADRHPELAAYLDTHGPGPYNLVLRTAGDERGGPALDLNRTHTVFPIILD